MTPPMSRWLELDSETLQAETPEQFRRMLAQIASAAHLKASQISLKSGIPRSQAYAMMKPSPVLPSKRNQVEAFLRVCNVAPDQADEIMQLWLQLSEATTSTSPSEPKYLPTTIYRGDPLREFESIGNQHVEVNYRDSLRVYEPERDGLVELLRYVVADERRTNRALRLMSRFGALMLFPLTTITFLITLLPASAAVVVGPVVAALVIAAVAASVWKVRQLLRLSDQDRRSER